jgi:Ca2+-binding EF-hand superfamily protein
MSNQHTAERKKIKAAFELFDRDNKEVCSREYVHMCATLLIM